MFSVGAPSADATVLAREVIQNSWDAAIELRQDSDDAPPFEIRFSFGSAQAERKRQLIARLGLDELAERLDGSDDGQLGLKSPNCLKHPILRCGFAFCSLNVVFRSKWTAPSRA